MKIIRKFLVFILGLLLFNLCGVFILSFSMEEIFQKNIVRSIAQESVNHINSNTDISVEQGEQIKAILEDKEVNALAENFVNEIIENMGDENATFDSSVIDNLFDYLIENKEKIEKATNTEIDISEIEDLRNSDSYTEFKNEFTQSINQSTNAIDDDSKMIIQTYSYVVSDDFRYIILFLIVVDLVLIALVQWSFYKWLSVLGRVLIPSGITLLLLSFVINVTLEEILTTYELTFDIDVSSLVNLSIIALIIGFLLVIACRVITKIITSNNEKNIQMNMES